MAWARAAACLIAIAACSDDAPSSTTDDAGVDAAEVDAVVPDPPAPVADSFTTPEDVALVVAAGQGLLANDVDSTGAVIETQPAHGSVAVAADGGFTYTPVADYFGADSFTYRATGSGLTSMPVTVSLSVTAVQDTPVLTTENFMLDEDTSISIDVANGVLANDTDADGDALEALLVTDVLHGTLTLAPDGSFSYVPDLHYYGTDSFVYAADDGVAAPAITVTIDIASVNDVPVATPVAAITTAEDTGVPITLTGVDIEDAVTAMSSFVSVSPQHGDLTKFSGPSPLAITYTPTANYSGTDSFSFAVLDTFNALSVTETVAITITAVNDPPVAVADVIETYKNTAVDVSVLANDSDVDSPAPTVMSLTQPANGTATFTATKVTYTPAVGYVGTDTFNYTVVDTGGAQASAQVTVTVLPGCCNAFTSCNDVCENDLGAAPTAPAAGRLVVIDALPRTVSVTIDTTPVTGSTLTLHYHTFNGTWSSQAVATADIAFDVPSYAINFIGLWVDGGEPVAFVEVGNGYSLGAHAQLVFRRTGGVWQAPVLINNTFVNSGAYDGIFDASYARVAGVPTIVFYAMVRSSGFNRRYTYISREVTGTWSAASRITVIAEAGWAPFVFDRNGKTTIIHGYNPVYTTTETSTNVFSMTDISSAIGMTANGTRGQASINGGSTLIAPNGHPVIAYTDGTADRGERVRYAQYSGTAWSSETVVDVGAKATNGGIVVGEPRVAFEGTTPLLVYDEHTVYSASSSASSVAYARRGLSGWSAKNLFGPNGSAMGVVSVGTGYVFIGITGVYASTGIYPNFPGYAYWCAGPQCPVGACNDGLQNGRESDVDCGGGTCGDCTNTKACLSNSDCTSNACSNAVCGP